MNLNVYIIIVSRMDVLGQKVDGLGSTRLNPQFRTKLGLLKMELKGRKQR